MGRWAGQLNAAALETARMFFSPDNGGESATAVEPEGEHALLVDDGAPAPAPTPAAAPAPAATPEAPAPEAPAATPPATPTPESPELKALREEQALLRQQLAELQAQRPPTPTPAPAAAPSAPPAMEDPTDKALAAIAADDYEVDVAKTPKDLAKAMLAQQKRYDAQIKALQEQNDRVRVEAAQEALRIADQQRAYAQLATEVKAKGGELEALHRQAAAEAEAYRRFGGDAFRQRTAEILQAKIDGLKPSPATPTPTTPTAPTPTSPAPAARPAAAPVTPGGANPKFPNTGGNPQPASSPVLTEDEIWAKHKLVV